MEINTEEDGVLEYGITHGVFSWRAWVHSFTAVYIYPRGLKRWEIDLRIYLECLRAFQGETGEKVYKTKPVCIYARRTNRRCP